jgi:hypothetical protein
VNLSTPKENRRHLPAVLSPYSENAVQRIK